jgi:hypothetical protein
LKRIGELGDRMEELNRDSELDGLAKKTVLEGLIAGNSGLY